MVEDDSGTRRLMADILTDSGYEPICARDGVEALEIMEHHHIDLIIADVMMPYMDGCTLTRLLREADYTLPILMVTAKTSQDDKKQGFRLGVDDYMTKPVDEEEMLLRIAALLRRGGLTEQQRRCVLRLENQWEAKDLTFDLALDALQYEGCEEMLDHVWLNLIGNAVKFSRPGGTIHISAASRGDRLEVCVRDEGVGMSRAVMEHVFNRFYQGDPSHAAAGNGLGLALVRRIVDLCGGEITVESTEGVGSAFSVSLPVRDSA